MRILDNEIFIEAMLCTAGFGRESLDKISNNFIYVGSVRCLPGGLCQRTEQIFHTETFFFLVLS